eukprot:Nk52_evm32s1401 gene=Nk52_evmTU32s1401
MGWNRVCRLAMDGAHFPHTTTRRLLRVLWIFIALTGLVGSSSSENGKIRTCSSDGCISNYRNYIFEQEKQLSGVAGRADLNVGGGPKITAINSEEDILGCAGVIIVKGKGSKFDFSSLKVAVYVSVGSDSIMKYETVCSPTGYFHVPIFGKGRFSVKILSNGEFDFEPDQVHVDLSQKNDDCRMGRELVFNFMGYRIGGRVFEPESIRGLGKPVIISLLDGKGDLVKEVNSSVTGAFNFNSVSAGQYTVRAFRGGWSFKPAFVVRDVGHGNGLVRVDFETTGLPVFGMFKLLGDPVPGQTLYLTSEDGKQTRCGSTCTQLTFNDQNTSCCAETDERGKYTFPEIAVGSYVIHYVRDEKHQFVVSPEKHLVAVGASEVENINFEVVGFHSSGYVLDAHGKPVRGARVEVEGTDISAYTDTSGKYSVFLGLRKKGRLRATFSEYKFKSKIFDTEMLVPIVNIFQPAEIRACGAIKVYSENVTKRRKISVWPVEHNFASYSTYSAERTGIFCFFRPHGVYNVSIDSAENEGGLIFLPRVISVTLDVPTHTLVFKEALGTVEGMIKLRSGTPFEMVPGVVLSSKNYTTMVNVTACSGNECRYRFHNIKYGAKYKVAMMDSFLCWGRKSGLVALRKEHALQEVPVVLDFEQAGYVLNANISHPVSLSFRIGSYQGTVSTKAGMNKLCLKEWGVYDITATSCFVYPENILYDTSRPKNVTLNAVEVVVKVVIYAGEEIEDLSVVVRTQVSDAVSFETIIGPDDFVLATSDDIVYQTDFKSKLNLKSVTFTPVSERFDFSPNFLVYNLSDRSCQNSLLDFHASEKVYLSGSISPPLPGVIVSSFYNGCVMFETVTEDDGLYSLGPVRDPEKHILKASKTGYHFVIGEERGLFHAISLSNISVVVVNEIGEPVQGVVISISCGDTRNSIVTGDGGRANFRDLLPCEYFVKPSHKELVFAPDSSLLPIEGMSEKAVIFKASKISFNCKGSVLFFTNVAPTNEELVVEAISTDISKNFHEDAEVSNVGNYELSGLGNKSTYTIRPKVCKGNTFFCYPPSYEVQPKFDVIGLDFLVLETAGVLVSARVWPASQLCVRVVVNGQAGVDFNIPVNGYGEIMLTNGGRDLSGITLDQCEESELSKYTISRTSRKNGVHFTLVYSVVQVVKEDVDLEAETELEIYFVLSTLYIFSLLFAWELLRTLGSSNPNNCDFEDHSVIGVQPSSFIR